MALERFIPKSPDPFIRNSQDFEVAKFGHLNTIIEYINSYVVTDSLQLAGSGPITSTARYITDSLGNASAISISTTRVGIGTTTPTSELHIDGHNGFGASLKITTNKVGGVAYVQMISDYVTGIEQYQYGGPGWGWPNWTTTRAGGTAAAPTAVPSNYGLNEYSFWGHDGTGGGQAYSMMTRTSETWTPTAHGIYTTFNTVATGSTSLVERMRFTGTGNITFNNASDTAKVAIKGSGSTSATTSLLVQNSSGTEALKVQDDNIVRTTYLGIGGGTSTNNIGGTHIAQFGNAVSSGDQIIVVDSVAGTKRGFKFGNQGTIRMALIQDGTDLQIGNFVSTFNPYVSFVYLTGNVGIGTTAPNTKLEVSGIGSILQLTNSSNSRNFSFNPSYATLPYGGLFTHSTGNITLGASLGTDNGSTIGLYLGGVCGERIAKLQVKGDGSTSATTSLLVQNSTGNTAFQVRDNLTASIGDGFTGDGIRFEASGNSSIIFRQGADRIFLTRTNGDQLNISFISGTNTLITSSGICNDGSGTNIWKFEGLNTAPVTVDTTKFLKIFVGGVAYKLAICV